MDAGIGRQRPPFKHSPPALNNDKAKRFADEERDAAPLKVQLQLKLSTWSWPSSPLGPLSCLADPSHCPLTIVFDIFVQASLPCSVNPRKSVLPSARARQSTLPPCPTMRQPNSP